MVAARADGFVEVDEPPTEPLALPEAPRPAARVARQRPAGRAVVVALAVAVLLVVGGATAWWWTGRAETGSLAAQPAAAAAGPSTVSAPAVAVPGPALIDTAGRALPPAAIEGVRRVYSAMQRGDMVTLKALYRPDDTASPWSTLQKRLSTAPTRERVLAALRRAPEPRREVAYLYSSGDYGLGLTRAGRIAFVGTGQGSSTVSAESAGAGGGGAGSPGAASGSPGAAGASGMPFECEDSFEGDGLPVPPACRRGGISDGGAGTSTGAHGGTAQGSRCSAELERCPSGYREGVKSNANPYGCNFEAISARNPCQWRFSYSTDGSTGRPAPATPAQRWAVCHLSGYREFC